jgi:5-methylcytosine-specific restriction protein A
MALRPNKPCRSRGCGALTRSPNGYCDAHQGEVSNWSKRPDRAGSTTARGYGHKWRQLREQVLKRDQFLCQCCARAGRVSEASEVDHIVAKAHGGTDAPGNLEAICVDCHKAKTARERLAGAGTRGRVGQKS